MSLLLLQTILIPRKRLELVKSRASALREFNSQLKLLACLFLFQELEEIFFGYAQLLKYFVE